MTMFGAPGSGKGFYGRLLAEAWQVPLYSASSILRASGDVADLDSGNLADCTAVTKILIEFIQGQQKQPPPTTTLKPGTSISTASSRGQQSVQQPVNFLMDGFPRTRRQVDLMNDTWPPRYRIATALHLNVPDEVCARKIAGRRICTVCQQEPNSADVNTAGFVLPPTVPSVCQNRCRPETEWKRRPDDDSEIIIAMRLADYRLHEQPLVDYYTAINGLVSFTPYHGIKDAYEMRQSIERWLECRPTAY